MIEEKKPKEPRGPMKITVAICTRNRAESLRRTLDGLTKMGGTAGLNWELLVIDNGSTDHTESVVEGFSSCLPVRRLVEARAGLSNARNRAVEEAKGEYIVWTDDDVIVDYNWLVAYEEAFRCHPSAALFGGKIIPKLLPPTPAWFEAALDQLGGVLAARDLDDKPIRLSLAGDQIPYGANYAIRMHEQRSLRYDPDLGASPYHRRYGEETSLMIKLLEAGAVGIWVPESVVHHVIEPERQTIRHVMMHFCRWGETVAFQEGYTLSRTWFGVPRWLLRRLVERFVRYRWDKLTKPPDVWVQSLIDYAHVRGMVDHWRNASRQRSDRSAAS